MKTTTYKCGNCGHFGGQGDFLSGDGVFQCPACGAPEENITKQVTDDEPVAVAYPEPRALALVALAVRSGTLRAEILERLIDGLVHEAEVGRIPDPKTLRLAYNAVRVTVDKPSLIQCLVDLLAGIGYLSTDKFVESCGENPTDYQPSN